MKKKILIVVANFYPKISKQLLLSAKKKIKDFAKSNVIYVPGAFEIPITIVKNIKRFDGFIALGCVIRGKTPHFDYICKTTNDAIMKISIDNSKPIGNGILTCLNKKQAEERINKGSEAAKAVISILSQ